MGHKTGNKKHKAKNHTAVGSFGTDFKNGLIATGNAWEHSGKTVSNTNALLKPVGQIMITGGQLERYGTSAVDSLGAKNPINRYNKNLETQFVNSDRGVMIYTA